jgi:hypothetical protein
MRVACSSASPEQSDTSSYTQNVQSASTIDGNLPTLLDGHRNRPLSAIRLPCGSSLARFLVSGSIQCHPSEKIWMEKLGNAFFLGRGQHRVLVQTNHNLSRPTFSDFNSYPTQFLNSESLAGAPPLQRDLTCLPTFEHRHWTTTIVACRTFILGACVSRRSQLPFPQPLSFLHLCISSLQRDGKDLHTIYLLLSSFVLPNTQFVFCRANASTSCGQHLDWP